MSDVSEYTQTDESDHEIAKRTIARTLTHDAVGKENAISSTELADRSPVSASTVRDLIKEIRREFMLPIGNANGYFLIRSREVFARQVERQKAQAETSLETARDIARAFNQNDVEGEDRCDSA